MGIVPRTGIAGWVYGTSALHAPMQNSAAASGRVTAFCGRGGSRQRTSMRDPSAAASITADTTLSGALRDTPVRLGCGDRLGPRYGKQATRRVLVALRRSRGARRGRCPCSAGLLAGGAGQAGLAEWKHLGMVGRDRQQAASSIAAFKNTAVANVAIIYATGPSPPPPLRGCGCARLSPPWPRPGSASPASLSWWEARRAVPI